MRGFIRSLPFIAALLCAGCAARPARAQFLGYTSPQTITQTIFKNQTSSALVVLNNVGQSIHYLTYSSSTSPCLMNIRLEGSYDNVAFSPFSEDGADSDFSPGTFAGTARPGLVASGYFPV